MGKPDTDKTDASAIKTSSHKELGVEISDAVFNDKDGVLLAIIDHKHGTSGKIIASWKVANGIFPNKHGKVSWGMDVYPVNIALVIINNEPICVVSTRTFKCDECEEIAKLADGYSSVKSIEDSQSCNSKRLYKVDAKTGGGIYRQLVDTSNIQENDWNKPIIVGGYKNILIANPYQTNSFHVYVDLKYQHSVQIPGFPSDIDVMSFTHEIFVVGHLDEDVISVYAWCPNTITFGCLIWGSRRAYRGAHAITTTGGIVVLPTDDDDADIDEVLVYDQKGNGLTRKLQEDITNVISMAHNNGKNWLITVDKAYEFD